MWIQEFADKYGVDTRRIDYLTTCGYLHPECETRGRYRIYGPKAEEEMKRILVLECMGVRMAEANGYLEMFEHVPKALWETIILDRIKENMEKEISKYRTALRYAEELQKGL